jgi:integrase
LVGGDNPAVSKSGVCDWRNWHKRAFKAAVVSAKAKIEKAYDLRHSAASLWLHEGINETQVAAWMGHSLSMLSATYTHVIAELDPADRKPAAEVITEARAP